MQPQSPHHQRRQAKAIAKAQEGLSPLAVFRLLISLFLAAIVIAQAGDA